MKQFVMAAALAVALTPVPVVMTASTAMARSFATALTVGAPDLPVDLVDERLTTVTASSALHGAGRNTRKQRDVIDQAAAVVLLQAWIDSRHARR